MSTYANAFGASPASAMALITLEEPYTDELATESTVIRITAFMSPGNIGIPAFLRTMTKGDADDVRFSLFVIRLGSLKDTRRPIRNIVTI